MFLHQKYPEIRMINGIPHEVWLRRTNQRSPIPSTVRYAGTGFFVEKDNVPYLVTAAHVASKITQHGFVTMRGKGDKPLSFFHGATVGNKRRSTMG